MNRKMAITTIAKVTLWLINQPDTLPCKRLSESKRKCKHGVVMAVATPNFVAGSRGVYLGYYEEHLPGSCLHYSHIVKLVDHGDPRSFDDYIPLRLTYRSRLNRPNIDAAMLYNLPIQQVMRMARNAERIMRAHGVP